VLWVKIGNFCDEQSDPEADDHQDVDPDQEEPANEQTVQPTEIKDPMRFFQDAMDNALKQMMKF
jgi:hypothetical protein